jgi:hypothetical protein
MADLMLDIETLGTTLDSVILTIGAIPFDPFTDAIFADRAFYARIDIDTQDRTVDEATVEWWGKQAPEVQEEAFGEDDRWFLSDALEALHKLAWQSERFWANGIAFDFPILENAYKALGMGLPWQYYKVMDARTVYKMANAGRLGNSHNALEDCINQVVLLQDSLKKLDVKSL